MGNPFDRFGVSDSELAKHIRESAEVDAAIDDFMANEVVPHWKSIAPVDSGNYAARIKVAKKAKNGRGVVAATAPHSHLIEYGTGGDTKDTGTNKALIDGQWVTLPDNTPTRALGIGERVAQHFGGHLTGGIDADIGDD